jgi:GT2 family glycosyltransferase
MPDRVKPWLYFRTASRLAWDAFREGRLSASPRRWLIDLKILYDVMRNSHASGALVSPPAVSAGTGNHSAPAIKSVISDLYRLALWAFLRSGSRLRFDTVSAPDVSVLLVLYNRAELTLRCLRALRGQDAAISLEVVIVDNGSSDETPVLLERIDGVHVIRSKENRGFLQACNAAALKARGEYLLFLNNDAELLPGSLSAAMETIRQSRSVGAVGGRLILPDGRLQEAGSIIWRDGSCLGYGRDDSPWAPQYAYERDVDYCSAALLLTPRQLFLDLGLFDERLKPAYYEDTDYCVRLWEAGRRVVYNPRAMAIHFEFASSASAASAIAMQIERRAIFVDSHRDWLRGQYEPDAQRAVAARQRKASGLRILMVDDQVPHLSSGFGFPRAVELVRALVGLGHFVTLFPTAGGAVQSWEHVYEDIPATVEVMNGYESRQIPDFVRERSDYYDCVVVSRPHNMQLLRAKLGPPDQWFGGARVIYDAEAIAAGRELERRRLGGEQVKSSAARQVVDDEVALARGVTAVLAVSAAEAQTFSGRGIPNVYVVSHSIEPTPTTRPFDAREGILFVGAFNALSPNADAAIWFLEAVLPVLRGLIGADVSVTVAGHNPPNELTRLKINRVQVVGSVPDLTPLYDAARVFIAPTRYAAGIPLKISHAAAHGLPVVSTRLLARQLDWTNDVELLAADTPEDFAAACAALYIDPERWSRVRDGALARIADDYSSTRFCAGLEAALSHAMPVAGRV